MQKKDKKIRRSIYLPEKIKNYLEKKSKETGLSENTLIILLLEKQIEQTEKKENN